MQASIDSLDTMVIRDQPVVEASHEQLDATIDNDAPLHSSIPYTLDIQDEDCLSIDMIRLYRELLPSKESHDRRVKFVKKMEDLMNREWPGHDIKAHVFGSSVNDLGASSSDVDLCITTTWNGLRNVRVLAKLFRKCGMQHVVCVPRAKVPIVRLFDPELHLSCDINVNNTLALHNTKMIKTYVAIDPRVRPLIMTLKHWTKQRILNDAANGGTLSSYTWTCMIINFLQQRKPPILPVLHQIKFEGKDEDYFYDNVDELIGFGSANQESLGGLLFAFFRRFAVEFDYDDQVVSVRQGRYVSKEEKGWSTGRNKLSLCVEEPFNVNRNLGNSADIASVRGLRREFQRFLDLLLTGEGLEAICAPYRPLTFINNTTLTNGFDNNTLSLMLPTETRTSPFFLPIRSFSTRYSATTPHPFDRRRSMVDGISSYPTPIAQDSISRTKIAYPAYLPSHTYRSPPTPTPYRATTSTFHPRFSSSQALDTILKARNIRHGSHPLPPVPSTLLSMLNIHANHGTEQPVDIIFARYHKKPLLSSRQSQSLPDTTDINHLTTPPVATRENGSNSNKHTKKGTGNNNKRKGGGNGNHHNNHEKKPAMRHFASGLEWPEITPSASAPTSTNSWTAITDQASPRSRRWSTTKKNSHIAPDDYTVPLDNLPPLSPAPTVPPLSKKKTLAEIVKVSTPPLTKQARPSPVPSTSTSSSKSGTRHRKPRTNNLTNNAQGNKQKKKNISNKPHH